MKKLFLAMVFILGALNVSFAQDSEADRIAAATRYANTVDFGDMLDKMMLQAAASLPEDNRAVFLAAMKMTDNDIAELRGIAITSMAKTFTAEELDHLAEFYGSPSGQSIMKKFPDYMGQINPGIQQIIVRKVSALTGQ
ncbi:DUF2059 domain-containing protein [Kiloniella litopenaei]|uniref:DUF2059 domain-containing protein n=1 Tax=Kiloniella litopenaei TaxID=1549748 RepID=UPI003BA95DB4